MKANFLTALFLACLLLLSTAVSAAPEPQVFTSENGSFGASFAADGNLVVVGSPSEVINDNERQGAAYVYELVDDQWQQIARLVASEDLEFNDFGHAVAVDDNVIVVSASSAEVDGLTRAGKAYVFQRGDDGSWVQTQILTAAEATELALFARDIAVDGNRIAISAPGDAQDHPDPGGAAYVFEFGSASESWQQIARVERPRTWGDDRTRSIDISGDLLATGTDAGTVFIWKYDGNEWREDHAVDLGRDRAYVRLEDEVLAASLPNDVWSEVEGIRVGRVHIHERNSAGVWKEVATLQSIEPEQDKRFGAEFDMNDGIIAASTGFGPDPVISLFKMDEEGEWIRAYELDDAMSSYRLELAVSANALVTTDERDDDLGAINVFDASELIASPNVANPSAGVNAGDPGKYTGDGTNNAFSSVIPPVPQFIVRSDAPLPVRDATDNFGQSMDAEEDLLLVGAPGAHAAYVFVHDGDEWREVAKLTPPGNGEGRFGAVVRLSGDYIAVSAPEAAIGGASAAGAIDVFERETGANQWNHAERLVSPNPFEDAELGTVMDFDGIHIVANVPGDNNSARLFTRNTQTGEWSATSPFIGEDGTQVQAGSVAVSDGAITLAARNNPVSIYESAGDSWMLQQQLDPGDVFDVAMEDGVLVIGMPNASVDERVRGEGVVAVYERGTTEWSRVATLEADEPNPTFDFGVEVEIQDSLIVVEENEESGGTYLYGQNNNAEWAFFDAVRMPTSVRSPSHDATVSALTLAVGLHGLPADPGVVHAYDIDQLTPEDYALDGNGTDTGDETGDDTGSDTGDGGNDTDDDAGGDDVDTGDDITDDDSDTIADDDGSNMGGAGGDTGGGTGGDTPPATGGGGGGGATGILLLFPFAFLGLISLSGQTRTRSRERTPTRRTGARLPAIRSTSGQVYMFTGDGELAPLIEIPGSAHVTQRGDAGYRSFPCWQRHRLVARLHGRRAKGAIGGHTR